MSTQTSQALTPRTLQRNRALFAAFIVVVATLVSLTIGWLNNSPIPGPLLLAVDEYPRHAARSEGRPSQLQAASILGVMHDGLFAALSDVDDLHLGPVPAMANFAPIETEIHDGPEPMAETDPDLRWFNGRPVRPVRTISMVVTAYSPDEQSCGNSADGITASGYSVWTNGMRLVAADTRVLPFGSMITVPGYDDGDVVPVLDRGGAIKGHRLDVLYATHEQAKQWGVQNLEVTVWEYADGKPNGFVARYNKASSVSN